MDSRKRRKVEKAGWQIGSADEFLELSPEETAYVDMKLALSDGLKRRRTREGITQANLAKKPSVTGAKGRTRTPRELITSMKGRSVNLRFDRMSTKPGSTFAASLRRYFAI